MNKNITKHKRSPMVIYTKKIGREIVERIAKGETLTSICKEKHMPGTTSVYRWLLGLEFIDIKEEHGKVEKVLFRDAYARARVMQADVWFDELVDISQTQLTGDNKKDSGIVQAARLRCDTLKWTISKLNPMKYGDKLPQNDQCKLNINISLTPQPYAAKEPIDITPKDTPLN